MRAFRGVLCLALSPLSLGQRQEMEHLNVRTMLQPLLQHNYCFLTADPLEGKKSDYADQPRHENQRWRGKKILDPCVNVYASEHTLSTKNIPADQVLPDETAPCRTRSAATPHHTSRGM